MKNIFFTPESEKDLKKLRKKYPSIYKDIEQALRAVATGKEHAKHIGQANAFPFYKLRVRLSNSNKGKSSGARVIYCYFGVNEDFLLIRVYVKSEQVNISTKEIETILASMGLKLEE